MAMKYIWIKKQRYYLYGTYNTYSKAITTAKTHRKKNKSRYFIIKHDVGFLFPEIKYSLYLNKVIKLW